MVESGSMNGESHRYNTRSKTRQDSLTSQSDMKGTATTTAGQKSLIDSAIPGPDTASDVLQPSSATSAMSTEDQLMSGTQPNPPPPTREQTSSVETGSGDKEEDDDNVTIPSSTASTLPSSSQTKANEESKDEMIRRVSNTPSMSSASGGLPKGLRRVPRKVDLAAAREEVPEDDEDEEGPHDQVEIVQTSKRRVHVGNDLRKGVGSDARDNDDEDGVMKAESEEISGSASSGRVRSSGAGAGGERLRRTSTGGSVDHYAQVLADPSSKVPAGGG